VRLSPFVSYQLSPAIDLSLDYSHIRTRDQGTTDILRVGSSMHLTTHLGLLLSGTAIHPARGRPDFQVGLLLYYAFGNATTASVSAQHSRSGTTTTATLSKSLPIGEGYGYRLSSTVTQPTSQVGASTIANPQADGWFQYQGRYGRVEAAVSRDQTGTLHESLAVAGSVAMVNGHVLAGRPIQDSFGVVRLEDLPDVHVTVDNAPIGATNRRGSLLIPTLLPYYGNTVAIATEDVPVDRMMEATTRLAAPPLHGGALIAFHAPVIRAIRGTIQLTATETPAVVGAGLLSLTVTDQTYESPLGRQGEFYLENVPPGDHIARVDLPNGVCRVRLHVPLTAEVLTNLGELPCVPEP
jgi:outer membrane usher protein